MSRRNWLWFANLVVAAALLAWFTNEDGVLQGDAVIYSERLDAILGGALPYRDAAFEHLPLSLLPLLATSAVATFPHVTYLLALATVNAALLAGVLWYAGRIGHLTGRSGAPRLWLLVAAPLFPIVLFRLDPFSLLLAAAALHSLLRGRSMGTTLWAMAGIAARGWPIVFVAAEWRRGWRWHAAATVAATLALTTLLLATAGFTEGRTFDGVQIETLVGSLLLLGGHIAGSGPDIHATAGSLYVGDGWMPAVVNAIAGAAVLAVAATRLRARVDTISLLTLATYGLLVLSPLLSAQMLLWPTLFVALLAAAPHRWIAITGVITTALLVWWQPETWWWATITLFRNGLLLTTPIVIAGRLSRDGVQARISRKNLPV